MQKTIKVTSLVLLCIFSAHLYANNQSKHFKRIHKQQVAKKAQHKTNPVIAISVPKCGTCMLMRCLAHIGVPMPQYERLTMQTRLDVPTTSPFPSWWNSKNAADPKRKYFWTHEHYSPEFEQFIDESGGSIILIIRDPRDMVVSLAHMIQTSKKNPKDTIALEPLLLDLIEARKQNYIPWGNDIHDKYLSIREIGSCNYFQLFLPYMRFKKCLTIRFENLVGEKGGGSFEKQFATIQQIAEHIGRPITVTRILEICDQLFGATATFREGKIGAWQKYFTPAVKAAFKAMPGSNGLLIELGYEKDDQW